MSRAVSRAGEPWNPGARIPQQLTTVRAHPNSRPIFLHTCSPVALPPVTQGEHPAVATTTPTLANSLAVFLFRAGRGLLHPEPS